MVKKPGMASKTVDEEMELGRFIELSTNATKRLPRDLPDALSKYLIEHPLFLGAVLDELRDVRPLNLDSKYFRLSATPKLDLGKSPIADWQQPETLKADAFAVMASMPQTDLKGVEYAHLCWADTGPAPRTMDVLRHIRASNRMNASAVDLLRYFHMVSSGCAHWGLNGATALEPFIVNGQLYTLSYSDTNGQQTWSMLPDHSEKLWPYNHGFFVYDGKKDGS